MRFTSLLWSASLLALVAADAGTILNGDKNNEGEDHDKLKAPKGARIMDIPIGNSSEVVTVYWSDPKADQRANAEHVYIIIHGKLRDGDHYWEVLSDALDSAIKADVPGASKNSFLIAPQFFSGEYNDGQYGKKALAFGDTNGWQAGDIAVHPKGTNYTSIDALDAIVEEFMDKDTYPSITNITMIGHGGGAQLLSRYAAVGADSPEGIHTRYIVGDASTHAYFSEHRPTDEKFDEKGCDFWNTWRYGFDNFTGTAHGKKEPKEYFAQYVNRDIVFIIGRDDTSAGGDQWCPALMQGGVKRRDRNLAWWTYINTLARTEEPVQLLDVANFTDLPDWSDLVSDEGFKPRLIVVEDVGHDAEEVFGSKEGRSALFNANNVPWGWRPKGYKDAKSDCTGCADDTSRPGYTNGTDDSDSDDAQDGNNAAGGDGNVGSDDGDDGALVHSLSSTLLFMLSAAMAWALL